VVAARRDGYCLPSEPVTVSGVEVSTRAKSWWTVIGSTFSLSAIRLRLQPSPRNFANWRKSAIPQLGKVRRSTIVETAGNFPTGSASLVTLPVRCIPRYTWASQIGIPHNTDFWRQAPCACGRHSSEKFSEVNAPAPPRAWASRGRGGASPGLGDAKRALLPWPN